MLKYQIACVTIALIAVVGLACAPAGAWKQDKFIVTFWCPPPATDKSLAAVTAEGFNLTMTPADGLDVARKYGLRSLVRDPLINPVTLDNPEAKAQLDGLIDRVKNNPATEGYYIFDEPGGGAFAGLGRLVTYLRERDPKHLAYINLFPTYATKEQLGVSADDIERARVGYPSNFAGKGVSEETVVAYREHLRQFIDVVKPELISYDHYHFLRDGRDGSQYFLNIELIREAALAAKLPFLNIFQACVGRAEFGWRYPTRDEVRWLAYTTLAYGGRGISYYVYAGWKDYGGLYVDGVQTDLGLFATSLNKEINALGPELMKLQSIGVYHTAPLPFGTRAIPSDSPVQIVDKGRCVVGLFARDGTTDTFMIVNRDYKKPVAARLRIADSVSGLRELNRVSGTWANYCPVTPGSSVVIDLRPGDGRLFRLVSGR